MSRPRIARIAILGAALALAVHFAGHWPKDQTVHYLLGDTASRVEELDARWATQRTGARHESSRDDDDWMREVIFRYAPGKAPRVVTQEARLPDGDYLVEIEIIASNSERRRVRRQVALHGGVTHISLDSASVADQSADPVAP